MTFKTLVNFRDLGQYKTKDGHQIVSKRIIDFRSEKEITEKPDDTIPHTQYYNIDMFKGDEFAAPALAQIEKERGTLSADERMMLVYEHLILSSVSQKGFQEFINLVAHNEEGSLIWHCFAGKDRTGIAAFLLLYLLGASEETIYDDYLQTNELRKNANTAILSALQAEGANQQKIEDTETMLTVKKEYLDYAIDLIKENYGTIDNYIENVLEISPKTQQKLREMYLLNS